jgi:hypothetical protein
MIYLLPFFIVYFTTAGPTIDEAKAKKFLMETSMHTTFNVDNEEVVIEIPPWESNASLWIE